ncbi:MAG: hypothetical protein ACKVW3_16175 [Phycisphaerales bacterium]
MDWEGILRAVIDDLREHAAVVDMGNVDEATVRSFLIRRIKSVCPIASCQTEWNRFDLFVAWPGHTGPGATTRRALIELKFFIFRRHFDADGTARQWKGGAGTQNRREFDECVRKLHAYRLDPQIEDRLLVLVYERRERGLRAKTFEAEYAGLQAGDLNGAVFTVSVPTKTDDLACVLLRITPPERTA